MIEVQIGRLAQQFGVHRNTITNWIKSGKLKATPTVGKRYLIDEQELSGFCKAARIPAKVLDTIRQRYQAEVVESWDLDGVSYDFKGQQHRVQMTQQPGQTLIVNERGEPRIIP